MEIGLRKQGEPLLEFVKRFQPDSEFLTEEGCYIVELRNVDEDPTCSIARARVEPGVKTKLHSLRGTVER
jgi:mannose-6-phosphate isomerase-like protein (cupin superfamily)